MHSAYSSENKRNSAAFCNIATWMAGTSAPRRAPRGQAMTVVTNLCFTILFDGVATGMLLFVLAYGLAVTLGLMRLRRSRPRRLRHGRRLCLRHSGEPPGLARSWRGSRCAFIASAAIGGGDRALALSPSLSAAASRSGAFTFGLVFIAVIWWDYGDGLVAVLHQPARRAERADPTIGVGVGRYRLMIIVVSGLLTAGLRLILSKRDSAVGCRHRRRSARRLGPRSMCRRF